MPQSTFRPANFSAPYWDATREKKLLLQYCPTSGRYQFYPRPISIHSGRRDLEWREVSGNGTIYSLTTAHMRLPGTPEDRPSTIALVELDEGVRVMAGLNLPDGGGAEIGQRVQACWVPFEDGHNLLQFKIWEETK